jgi:hypothetical protein
MDSDGFPCHTLCRIEVGVKMKNQTEQKITLADSGAVTPAIMKEQINRLKGQLEAKLARTQSKARWEGMVEDCEILLNHLDPTPRR